MSFDRLVGQERLIGFLSGAIRADRLPHALLVVGPRGSGKRTLAREMGKALLCAVVSGDACDACRECRLVEHGNHPDFGVFAREAEHSAVRIETARALQGALALKPFRARRKVAVLPEANLLTEEAANALLKTLEEPPGDSVVVLLAESASEMLPTVLSRCQVLKMQRLGPSLVAAALERERGVPAEAARYAAAMAGGSLGRALELVEPEWYDMKRWVVEQFSGLSPEGVFALSDEMLSRAQRLGRTAADVREVLCRALDFAVALYRDAAAGGAVPAVHADQADRCPVHLGPRVAGEIAERLLGAQAFIQANANPGLVLDAVFIEIAERQATAAVGTATLQP